MITRNKYRLFADVIKRAQTKFMPEEDRVKFIADEFAAILAKDNPRFSYHRFMEACGFKP